MQNKGQSEDDEEDQGENCLRKNTDRKLCCSRQMFLRPTEGLHRFSMIEMIMEKKGISQPEELEELLACYLTLNSYEYHDLVIRVFRLVWFGLIRAHFDAEGRGGERERERVGSFFQKKNKK